MKLLLAWTNHQTRMFWRSRVSAFFTIGLPLLMMLLFASIFNGEITSDDTGFSLSFAAFYVPSMASFAAASATYTNLAISTTIAREERILKRVRGTPLPQSLYIFSAVLSAIWIAFLGTALMLLVGILAFNTDIIYSRIPWMIVFFLLGVTVFSILGLALASATRSARAAPAITNATLLPLAFISGIFIYTEQAPEWMRILGTIFPLKAFSEGLRLGFDSSLKGDEWINLGILVLWGAAGFIYMAKFFKWVPSAETPRVKNKIS